MSARRCDWLLALAGGRSRALRVPARCRARTSCSRASSNCKETRARPLRRAVEAAVARRRPMCACRSCRCFPRPAASSAKRAASAPAPPGCSRRASNAQAGARRAGRSQSKDSRRSPPTCWCACSTPTAASRRTSLKPVQPSVTLRAAGDTPARRRRLPLPRHRAHPARRRSPAVRARTAADRARPLDAGEDRHRVHAWRTASRWRSPPSASRRCRRRRSTRRSRCRSCSSVRRSCAAGAAQTSFTIRHPWVVAFAFGLLHGFGFASGLAQLGLPKGEIPLALLLFNVGVEIGQLAFVLLILLLERAFRLLQIHWPRIVERLPGYLVGTLGAFWTIQRVAILLRGVA